MSQRRPIINERFMHVTTNIQDHRPIFKDEACARTAIETLYLIQEHLPFFLYAFAIMPDHCHFLLKVPAPGSISDIMKGYKRAVNFNSGKGPIWQARYYVTYPHRPTDTLHYIHENPVKEGLCLVPADYPWSSASGRWDVTPLDYWNNL